MDITHPNTIIDQCLCNQWPQQRKGYAREQAESQLPQFMTEGQHIFTGKGHHTMLFNDGFTGIKSISRFGNDDNAFIAAEPEAGKILFRKYLHATSWIGNMVYPSTTQIIVLYLVQNNKMILLPMKYCSFGVDTTQFLNGEFKCG